MFFAVKSTLAIWVASVFLASAQLTSPCNPMKKTCPSDPGLAQSKLSFDFTQTLGLDEWSPVAGTVKQSPDGGEFSINKQGESTTFETKFYIFFGEVSATMKASPGRGIVSTIVLWSDSLDEVDWEALGGESTKIQTNYFGKDDRTIWDRSTTEAVSNTQDFHTYKVTWTKEKIIWFIDGKPVRTLNYNDAKGGRTYPQTPMRIRLGIWAAGDPTLEPGTIDWAGGLTDYTQAPFNMYVKDVSIVNYNPAEFYTWTDRSGSYESIDFYNSTGPTSVLFPIKATSSVNLPSPTESSSSRITDGPTASAKESPFSNSSSKASPSSGASAVSTNNASRFNFGYVGTFSLAALVAFVCFQ